MRLDEYIEVQIKKGDRKRRRKPRQPNSKLHNWFGKLVVDSMSNIAEARDSRRKPRIPAPLDMIEYID